MNTAEARAAMLDAIRVIEAHAVMRENAVKYAGEIGWERAHMAAETVVDLREESTLAALRRLTQE